METTPATQGILASCRTTCFGEGTNPPGALVGVVSNKNNFAVSPKPLSRVKSNSEAYLEKQCSITLKPLIDIACTNSSSSLTAFYVPTDVNATFAYSWSTNSTDVGLTNTTGLPTPTGCTNTFTINSATNSPAIFTVAVSDPNGGGCTVSTTASVVLKKTPELTVATSPATPNTVCATDPVTFTMSLANPAPTNWASYIMINSLGEGVGENIWTGGTAATITINPAVSAQYTIYAYDGQCAVESDPIVIQVPSLNLGDNKYVCINESYQFTEAQIPDFSGWNGVTGTTYDWFDGNTTVATDAYPSFQVTNITTYTVTVTINAATTCTLTGTVTLYPVSCCSTATADVRIDNASKPEIETAFGTIPNTGTLVISGKEIDINGRLTVKGYNLKLEDCILNMGEAAEILVDSHFVLTLKETTLNPCSLMWKGFNLGPAAKLRTIASAAGSQINGAEYAILGHEGSDIDLQKVLFDLNYISIFVPSLPNGIFNNGSLTVSDVKFSFSSSFPGRYINQTTSPGNKGYAGLEIHDMVADVGINGAGRVEFSDLNNGILSINSTLKVINSTFTNIKNYDLYTMPLYSFSGTGILSIGEPGKFSSLTQIGISNLTTFEDVRIGIHAHRSSLYAANNTMRTTSFGIFSNASDLLSTEILQNNIEADNTGILVVNNLLGSKVLVEKNIISSWGSTSHTFAGIYSSESGRINPDAETRFSFQYRCNEISGDFFNGLVFNNNQYNYLYRNAVDQSSTNMKTGFRFEHNSYPFLDNNTVIGSSTSSGTGYHFNTNYFAYITDNYSSTTATGFEFRGPNNNTFLKNNYMLLHDIGLRLMLNASIGPQFNFNPGNNVTTVFNNNWLADNINGSQYSTKGAVDENNTNLSALNNQILYDDIFLPGSIKAPQYNGGANWFRPWNAPGHSTPNISNTCELHPIDPPNPTDPTIHDRLVAKDSVHTSCFDEELAMMQKQLLFDKLDTNEELRNSEEYFSDFYDFFENETLGQQSRVRRGIRLINEDASDYSKAIDENYHIIQGLQLQKSCNDSVLYSGTLVEMDSLAYLDSNFAIISEINNTIFENNNIKQQFIDGKTDKIESAKELNDEVTTSTLMETNEKTVNDIYLRIFATDIYELDETDYENLLEIANQCPFSGGHPVFEARAMLASIGDSTEFDDETACEEEENLRKAFSSSESRGEVFVNPNPSNNIFKFIFRLPKNESAELIVVDSYSKTVFKQALAFNSKSISINFENFANGIYYYTVNSQSGLIGNGKLILIK